MADDPARLRRFVGQLERLATAGSSQQRAILKTVAKSVKAQIQHQLATGTMPDGSPQKDLATGKRRALQLSSPRWGNLIVVEPITQGIKVRPSSKVTEHLAGSLETQQHGFVFAAQTVRMHRDRRGRLISYKRFVALAKEASGRGASGGFEGFSTKTKTGKERLRAFRHKARVGQRVLPQHMVYPEPGTMPTPWEKAINDGFVEGFGKFLTQAAK